MSGFEHLANVTDVREGELLAVRSAGVSFSVCIDGERVLVGTGVHVR